MLNKSKLKTFVTLTLKCVSYIVWIKFCKTFSTISSLQVRNAFPSTTSASWSVSSVLFLQQILMEENLPIFSETPYPSSFSSWDKSGMCLTRIIPPTICFPFFHNTTLSIYRSDIINVNLFFIKYFLLYCY